MAAKALKKEEEMQKCIMALCGGLTKSCERKSEKQRRKGKIDPFECRVPKNSKWALGNITMNHPCTQW